MSERQIIKSRVIEYILNEKRSMNENFIDFTALEIGKVLKINKSYRAISLAMLDNELGNKKVLYRSEHDDNLSSRTAVRYFKYDRSIMSNLEDLNFRKISAKDNIFVLTKKMYEKEMSKFNLFLTYQSLADSNIEQGMSGKANSYVNYMIRVVLFINEIKGNPVDIVSSYFIKELKILQKQNEFKIYNENENRFPNAAINSFIKYWLTEALNEDDEYDNQEFSPVVYYESNDNQKEVSPKVVPGKLEINGRTTYKRNPLITVNAKKAANWQCEIDNSHATFISKITKSPFVEAHHLIPMALQDNYEYSLDILPNVISLCPNCHRKIHHGLDEDKIEVLEKLFNEREEALRLSGIFINYKELLELYNINIED